MPGLAFISYRRDDTGSEAQGLYLQLKGRFGSGQLFMDVNSVPVGSPWPQRVKDKLLKATVVLAMIGPGWLTASDQYGRGRLDFPDDWVHLELATGLARGTPIIAVVVGAQVLRSASRRSTGQVAGTFRARRRHAASGGDNVAGRHGFRCPRVDWLWP